MVLKIAVSLLMLCSVFVTRAQEPPQTYTLDQMKFAALEHNPILKNSELLVERSLKARRSAWDLGMTDFEWTRGQINTEAIDNNLTFTQNLGSPFMHAAKRKMYTGEADFFQYYGSKVEKEIKRDVSKAYYKWLLFYTLGRISDETLVYLEKAASYAGVQYSTGETNLLSKMLIETKYLELLNYRQEINTRMSEIENTIQQLTCSDEKIIPADTILTKISAHFTGSIEDSLALGSPDVLLKQREVELARTNLNFYRSGLSPSFQAGYFNQQIDRISGFEGWKVGISFPVWFIPQQSRIQMASIDLSVAGNRYEYQKKQAIYDLRTLTSKLKLVEERLDFYESRMLGNADIIEQNALVLYQTGEINYIEYIQNILTAIKTREDYWTLVNDYNQLMIEIEYYLSL